MNIDGLAESEVYDDGLLLSGDDDVGRLDISMEYIIAEQIMHCLYNSREDE